MFVRPALRKLQGFRSLTPEWVSSVATENWKTPKGRTQIIPVRIVDRWSREVSPAATGGSGSHLIASLAHADGYAKVDAGIEDIRAGDEVQSVRLRDPEQFNHQPRSLS
jgi:molybdopterin molybdotransferase